MVVKQKTGIDAFFDPSNQLETLVSGQGTTAIDGEKADEEKLYSDASDEDSEEGIDAMDLNELELPADDQLGAPASPTQYHQKSNKKVHDSSGTRRKLIGFDADTAVSGNHFLQR